jgi:general secretion pathway protein E
MVKVLTAKGGEFQVSDEMRNMLALLEDGRLIIGKSYASNPHVRGFVSRLKRLGVHHTVQLADLSVVASYYTQEKGAEKYSDMQMAAKALFEKAVHLRASDIHIRVSQNQRTQIYFRVHNDLEFVEEHTFDYGDKLCSTIYQAMADVSDSTFEYLSRQDARISEKAKLPTTLDGIRVATSPQVGGYIMVLRLLYNDTTDDLELTSLGFTQAHIECLQFMKRRPTGVVIIGGPTGSGKSTTLQRVLSGIIQENQGRKHIITVEDPPEYPINGAVQTPVSNADTEEDRSREFQKAIKASMRLDPDIIMLSEVRDNPTARLVIQAAMTGHQVWTTVHANSALAIIDRFRDLGVSNELLCDPTIISGLICQRLVKRLCGSCRKKLSDHMDHFNPEDARRIMRAIDVDKAYVQGDGCRECRGSGTIGRTVVAEIVLTDDKLMGFIRDGNRLGALGYVKKELGVKSMLEHTIEKINEGFVDPFQAESIVGDLDASPYKYAEDLAVDRLSGAVSSNIRTVS